MAIAQENKLTNVSGTFPNALIIDASGAGLTDGSEYAALQLNDNWDPFQQAVMSYASGVQLQNVPTGSVGVPNGVADSVGLSQMLEALLKLSGTGPGKGIIWFGDLDPSVTGDRVILLSGQGVLISVYPGLDAAVYVGDTANPTVGAGGGAFYRSSDAAGLTPNIAGPYLQLPDAPGRTLRILDSSGAVDPDGASRFLGDVQLDAMQKTTGQMFFRKLDSGVDIASSFSGVLAEGADGANLTGVGNGAVSNPTQRITFDSSSSTSPNAAKTDDVETRGTNISFHLGVTY